MQRQREAIGREIRMSDDLFPHNSLPDITPIVETFSQERWEVAIERAFRVLGSDADPESDEFIEEVAKQLKLMVFKDAARDLEAKGVIEAVGIDEDGEIQWALTEGAKRVSRRIEDNDH